MKKFKEKYFNIENKTITTEDILHFEEEIIETYKPNKRAYVMSHVFSNILFIIPWLATDIFAIVMMATSGMFQIGIGPIILGIAFIGLHLTPIWMWLANIIKALIKIKNIEYILTNKRVIIKEGNKLLDTYTIGYTTIISVTTEQPRAKKPYNVGNIILITQYKSVILHDLNNYNEIATIIHKKSVVEYENQRLNDAQY